MQNDVSALSSQETTRTLIAEIQAGIGQQRKLTDKQLQYLELALLDNETLTKLAGESVYSRSTRIKALCKLLNTSDNVVYAYQNDLDMNAILWKIGIGSFSRILPAYLNNIEKGVIEGDKEAMNHARALAIKLIDVKEKQEIHLTQNNYLNADGKTLNDLVREVRKKHESS
jgi:hypothetical protein